MRTFPGKDSPVRIIVVPQLPQKCEVICFPVSAVLEMVFGVPGFVVLGNERVIAKEGILLEC